VAAAVYTPVLVLAEDSALGPDANPTSAVGLYLALVVLPVAAHLAARLSVPRPLVAVAAFCVLLMPLGAAKGVLVALVGAILALALLSPRPLLVGAAGLAIVAASFAISLGLQAAEIGNPPAEELVSVTADVAPTEFSATTEAGGVDNARWRLSYWKYEITEAATSNPVLGVGFGRPADFTWRNLTYDTRSGEGEYSVSPPHNSFVNVFFRTGLLGLLALAALGIAGLVRTLRARRAAEPGDRAWYAALVALVVFAAGIASLNVALEGPYMGIVIWTLVGLTLVVPRRLDTRA
jgi:hypothetical protein